MKFYSLALSLVAVGSLSLSFSAEAGNPQNVIRKAERVSAIVSREAMHMRAGELDRVDLMLDDLINELRGRGGGGGRGPILTARCHVDDDPQFDWDQVIAGDVQGDSVSVLLSDCAAMASSMYRSSSFGIKGVTLASAVPPGHKGATCHIDDDPQFDFDQIVVGELSGHTLDEIKADCASIAAAAYPGRGSSGLKNFKNY